MNAPESEETQPDPERIALLRLSLVEGLGPARLRNLLQEIGSAQSVLAASAGRLANVRNIGDKLAQAIIHSSANDAQAEWNELVRFGVRLITEADDQYPPGLREIHTAPLLLMMRGSIKPTDKLAVAIVGTRRCSDFGRRTAEKLARDLAARGVTIVSGLARGIDAAAHQAAINAGGRTIAVLASGLANIYPPEHVELAEEVAQHGALVSEAPLTGPPIAALFPQRNRIISGMSLGVVVVEAAQRSGALSTARHALDQNREVFAVPGRVDDLASEGANHLIQQGAHLVTCADDIIEQLGPIELPASAAVGTQVPSPAITLPPGLDETQTRLWNALDGYGVDFETILEHTGLRASEASSALFLMELRKLVQRMPGNKYRRLDTAKR